MRRSRGDPGGQGEHRWRLREGAEWAEAEQRRVLEEKPWKGKSRMKGAEDGQAAGAETPGHGTGLPCGLETEGMRESRPSLEAAEPEARAGRRDTE